MAEADKIQLLGTAYSVTVSRTLWSENSADNKPADLVIRTVENGRSGYISYEAIIERFADGTAARVVLVGAVSAALYQESFVMGEHSLCILFDNHLFIVTMNSTNGAGLWIRRHRLQFSRPQFTKDLLGQFFTKG